MSASLRRFVVLAAAALLVTGALTVAGQAAPPRFGFRGAVVLPNSAGLVNPNYQIYPGLSINQYAYNVSVLGRAYSRVPPYAYGYNPYPPAIVNYGPVYPAYTPYGYNPYAAGYGTYNPYAGYGIYP
jgi:hypothetical protein